MQNAGALRDLHLRLRNVEEYLILKRDHRFTRLEEWAHSALEDAKAQAVHLLAIANVKSLAIK